jgi:sugar/nucleoside kinase (ribokinase family)
MKWEVSVIGPLNIDLLINGEGPKNWEAIPTWDGPAAMEMTAAGSVGYTVRDLARLGLRVRVTSCVSDDSLGTFITDTLQREGVNTIGVRRVPGTLAGIGVYALLFGSRKRPLIYRMPTHDPWPRELNAMDIDDLLDARLLLGGGYLHFQQMWHANTVILFQEAKRRGLTTVLDPQFPLFNLETPWIKAMQDLLPYIDLLLCDENEALHSTNASELDQAAEIFLKHGPRRVVIKQGAQGVTVYQAGYRFHQGAIYLGEVVDTIGAGDAFDAGFTFGLLRGWPLERCALFASVAAGKTVTGVGGSETMPSAVQVEEIIRKRGLERRI